LKFEKWHLPAGRDSTPWCLLVAGFTKDFSEIPPVLLFSKQGELFMPEFDGRVLLSAHSQWEMKGSFHKNARS
jgi:hypothetical protein